MISGGRDFLHSKHFLFAIFVGFKMNHSHDCCTVSVNVSRHSTEYECKNLTGSFAKILVVQRVPLSIHVW